METSMAPRSRHRLPPEPPPPVLAALRKRLSGRDLEALGTLLALRTAAQQAENAVTEWLAGSAGSPARLQILVLLWASGGDGVPHKAIVAALGVTRATVSGLMAALERDGLVKSAIDRNDRRNLIASPTSKGQAVAEKAVEANTLRLRAVFAPLSRDELATATALLQRIRQSFAASGGKRDQPEAEAIAP
jgi:DNA-binding MarR family transcriptional regulator